jgi:hypothetical protein
MTHSNNSLSFQTRTFHLNRMNIKFALCISFFLSLSPSTISSQSIPSYLPTDGLVAWYPFNGNANDESWNGNDGVVNGATLTEDRFANANAAFGFDGVDDYIDCGDPTQGQFELTNSGLSISAWIKIQSENSSGASGIVSKSTGSNSLGDFSLAFNWEVDKIWMVKGYGGFGSFVFANTALEFNQWKFVTAVAESSGMMSIYINGQLSNGNSFYDPWGPYNSAAHLLIGKLNDNFDPTISDGQHYLNGQLDDIAIYNRALTQAEVTALYNATATNTGGGTTSTTPAPPCIPYQAEVRSDNGEVLANANVNVRFTLHELSANGAVSYQETHALTTNELGLFATSIGAGTATQGTFAGINWSQTTKFLQVEVDAGNGYITMGNQQLMSVPYAQYAQKAHKLDTQGLPVFENNAQALAGGLQAGDLYRTSFGDLKVVY